MGVHIDRYRGAVILIFATGRISPGVDTGPLGEFVNRLTLAMGLLRNSVKLTEDRARQRAARPTSWTTRSSSAARGAGKAAEVSGRLSTGRIGSRGFYRLQPVPADSREDHLRFSTLSRGTREIYWKALLDFEKFCADGKLSLLNLTVVDKALEVYFTDRFFNGYGPAEGRNALFGYIHFRTAHDRNKARPFPRASRCLRGWERRAPQRIRDLMHYGGICLFGNHFLDLGRLGRTDSSSASRCSSTAICVPGKLPLQDYT